MLERVEPIVFIKNNIDIVITLEDFWKIKNSCISKHTTANNLLVANVWEKMNFYIFDIIVRIVLQDRLHEQSMELLQNYYKTDAHQFIWYICLDIYEYIRDTINEYLNNENFRITMTKKYVKYKKDYHRNW